MNVKELKEKIEKMNDEDIVVVLCPEDDILGGYFSIEETDIHPAMKVSCSTYKTALVLEIGEKYDEDLYKS